MIADPSGTSQQFTDQDIQDYLDIYRDDIRYETLKIAPSIVNLASTNNQPSIIFGDYYSDFQFWEDDFVVEGNNVTTKQSWVVLTPVLSEPLVGHWAFELNIFTSGTVPGQYPPVFITGKIYDCFASAADLLEFWGATLAGAYDITVDGQTLRRSQLMTAKLTMAQQYRKRARARQVKMVRQDVRPDISTRRYRLLDSDDVAKGRW